MDITKKHFLDLLVASQVRHPDIVEQITNLIEDEHTTQVTVTGCGYILTFNTGVTIRLAEMFPILSDFTFKD